MASNIDHLVKLLKDTHLAMFQDKSLRSSMSRIGDEIQGNTISSIKSARGGSGKSTLSQTGRLYSALREPEQVEVRDSGRGATSMKVGYGNIQILNEDTKRLGQTAVFQNGNTQKTISLRGEPELPSWIIMEFGRKGTRVGSPTGIPRDFKINYSPRDKDKRYMFGPSVSIHYRKPIFFMANKQRIADHFGKKAVLKRHPGIREKRFFRDGLQKSIPFIEKEIGGMIEDSLQRQLLARGWERRYYY